MSELALEADYVVIGSGAVGMAFTDTMLSETEANFILIDRRDRPGGHWNDAYPFVRLHQPSAFYGVNSRELGSNRKDNSGLNEGHYELASGTDVCSYFDHVMQDRFLPSGRVRYFPMHDYGQDGHIRSLLSGDGRPVRARRKIVDATWLNTAVPATHPPKYEIANGVTCVPINDLARVKRPYSGYVIVGAGKTGIDACLWLLENGADPNSILWIMPRDAWLLDRANIQPGEEFFARVAGSVATQVESAAAARSIEDLFDRLEATGQLLRLDRNHRPSMYRCATVTRAELDALRRIKNIVRLGRVKRIEKTKIVLEKGSVAADPDFLYVDCSASGLHQRPVVPVFDGGKITLQTVRTCQPVFSAAFIGHVEAAYEDDDEKNELCAVVPIPDRDTDWLRMAITDMSNRLRWMSNDNLTRWLVNARLDGFAAMRLRMGESDAESRTALKRYAEAAGPGLARLQRLLADAA